jgi:transcription antitermination factor NusG
MINFNFKVGDRVKVVSHEVLDNFEGKIEAIHEERHSLTVKIDMYGHLTLVELEYWQIAVT